ncbi:MAG: 7-carboxy-7-deazaguanine synthase [Saprospiraceae bacterium]|nr:7-carboxy-7-deazaguanine synthase [Saprospiraceae bacterium]
MAYKIKEIYYTLQGEGAHAGRPAIFCRFSGCNLWTGREEDRAKAICKFCDTDFWGMDGKLGGKYTARDLVFQCRSLWPENSNVPPYVVCTGGEPALQIDQKLIEEFHKFGFKVAIETNGTLHLPEGLDWICISPKANSDIVIEKANEIKIVFPQIGINPIEYEDMDVQHWYIQPMDNVDLIENTKKCVSFCKDNPKWSLSVQSHKYINIP